ncbi:MAG: 1-(5-phosphoribosyl)-5-amino-4-imidazole-carboxylate carboxylase [Omnitrophica bacterium RIFCSPLOWO2_01_FULL_45_10]|nr:MAG: 1-(5-phosphoribosyl)-5-amino-4-imidazole-carboxylate carboxylase [Omnitrophica bacterium RIFCSPLOWO2_01_FULL_45_10]
MTVNRILMGLKSGRITINKALKALKALPYQDLGFAKIDHHRSLRRGFPEVIFGKGKTNEQILKIAKKIIAHDGILLITHANSQAFSKLKKLYPKLKYYKKAKLISYRKTPPVMKKGICLVVTGGTADISVAEEAKATLELMGNGVKTLYDVGVAGLHRVLDKRELLEEASVIIVIAGMEGALASVVSGLISKPVIAVPTSVGYGASFKGIAPLLTMLNCCSPGIAVVNIDNGFGAGYFASLINR